MIGSKALEERSAFFSGRMAAMLKKNLNALILTDIKKGIINKRY